MNSILIERDGLSYIIEECEKRNIPHSVYIGVSDDSDTLVVIEAFDLDKEQKEFIEEELTNERFSDYIVVRGWN